MNDTSKLCIAVVLVAAMLIVGPTACVMRSNAQVVDAIRAGADPMSAACAIKGDQAHDLCLAVGSARR